MHLRPVCVWRSRSETSPCGRSSRCSPACLGGDRVEGSVVFIATSPPILPLPLQMASLASSDITHRRHPLPSYGPFLCDSPSNRWHPLFIGLPLSCFCNYCESCTFPPPSFPFSWLLSRTPVYFLTWIHSFRFLPTSLISLHFHLPALSQTQLSVLPSSSCPYKHNN